jgi:hypothetical protein
VIRTWIWGSWQGQVPPVPGIKGTPSYNVNPGSRDAVQLVHDANPTRGATRIWIFGGNAIYIPSGGAQVAESRNGTFIIYSALAIHSPHSLFAVSH